MSTPLTERVNAALDTVMDPCSVATRHPLSIVELGLVVDVGADPDGRVRVQLRPTSQSCTLIPSIMQAVEERVSELDGVSAVDVSLARDAVWSPDLMTEGGRRRLEAARERTRLRLGIRPYLQNR